MNTMTLALILAAVVCSTAGQLLLKAGARHLTSLNDAEFLLRAVTDVRVIGGLLAWTAATVCWLYVLKLAPLSRAYGLSSLTYVLIPLASIYVFGEHVRRLHVIGMVLILVGIACVLADARRPGF